MQSINYNIDIVQGIVYLMGVAQTRAELNRVIETARTIPDIKQVVSYVKLAGEVDQDFTPDTQSQIPQSQQETINFRTPDNTQNNSANNFNKAAPTPLYRSEFQDIQTENLR